MLLEPRDDARVEAFTEAFASGTRIRVSTSRWMAFTDLVVAMEQGDDPGRVELLTDDATVSELRDDFLTGIHLAEAVDDDVLEVRSQTTPVPTLLIAEATVTAITGFPGTTQTALESSDETFRSESSDSFRTWFEDASPVHLRKPQYSVLFEEIESRFDEGILADFKKGLQIAQNETGPHLAVDPVLISLLVAAKHELEFYDISRWGEDTNFASRATFSRMKSALEEADLIDNEPVRRPVGRPRHQLVLAGDVAGATDVEELITAAEAQVSL